MNDRIKVSGEVLNRWASQLNEVSGALDDALSVLNGLNMSAKWWNKVGNLSTLRTKLAGSFQLGNARGAVRGISSALRSCGSVTNEIGKDLRETGARFDSAAAAVDRLIGGLSSGSSRSAGIGGGIGGITGGIGAEIGRKSKKIILDDGRIIKEAFDEYIRRMKQEEDALRKRLINYLHYPSDMSTWTETMKKKFQETLKDAKVYNNSDGSTIYRFGDAFVWTSGAGALLTYDKSTSFTKFEETLTENRAGGSYRKTEFSASIGQIGAKGKVEFDEAKKKKLEDLESMWGKKDSKKNGFYDKNGNRLEDQSKGKESSRKMTILEAGVDAGDGVAWRHGEKKREGKYGAGEVSGDIGYAEYKAGIHGGLYRTEVKADGTSKRVFEPGVSAEIGGSFGLMRGTAKGHLGSDNLNVHGEVEGKVAYAEASAKGELGIVDGKLAARVKASAEANVVSVGGKVGVNLGGIEGNVGANVKVGVGAHADVGYHDGVVKVDIGAAVGIGVDVNFELNIGKAVDNAVDGAKKVVADIGKGLSKLKFW